MTRNMKQHCVLIATLVMTMATTLAHADGEEPCQPQWVQTFGPAPGTGPDIDRLKVMPDLDTGEPALFVTGYLESAGGKLASRVAVWTGSAWKPIGSGINNSVWDMVMFDDGSGHGPMLHVAGSFNKLYGEYSSNIARWNGAQWESIGINLGQFVFALATYDDGTGSGRQLYAGGTFSISGGIPFHNIAKWTGSEWVPVADGVSDSVYSLQVIDEGAGEGPELFATGTFTSAGGASASKIAKWDGTWSAHSDAVFDGNVEGVKLLDDGSGPALYAFGSFTMIDGQPVNRVARWNGATWEPIAPTGPDGTVYGLEVFDDGSGPEIFVAGNFEQAGGIVVNYIAKWTGKRWLSLEGGTISYYPGSSASPVREVLVFDDGLGDGPALYAGGYFFAVGDVSAHCIAKWNGSWSALHESGLDRSVEALAWHDDGSGNGAELYAGGEFLNANGHSASHVAKWTGSQWEHVGEGLKDRVTVLKSFDDGNESGPSLFAGGHFFGEESADTNMLRKWNGSVWSDVPGVFTADTEFNYPMIHAMTVFDDGLGGGPALYVSGVFSHINDLEVNGIAKWDGQTWTDLNGGLTWSSTHLAGVYSPIVFDDGTGPAIFVGGTFKTAGGVNAYGVAKWDGTNWHSVGGLTMTGPAAVYALEAFDDGSGDGAALYIAGNFTTFNGVTYNKIAKLENNTWLTMGGGVGPYYPGGNFTVHSLSTFDDGTGPALYVGGYFGFAGSMPVMNLARWDGFSWSIPGEATEKVRAMKIINEGRSSSLVIAGSFGGATSGDSYIAKYQGCARVCLGDVVNGDTFAPPPDGEVDGADLAYLLVQWGRNPGSYADIVSNATFLPPPDGVVDGADLAVVLDAWGECE